jgi:hypothetical protein
MVLPSKPWNTRRWETAALRDLNPTDVRFGSKPEKLRVSKCFPVYPRKRTPIFALMGTQSAIYLWTGTALEKEPP